MISYLVGDVAHKEEGYAVIEVSGIGYDVLVSNQTLSLLPNIGEQTKLFTYMQVKEDGISLCGFTTTEEKEMFLKLIQVDKIGPKVGLAILSGIKLSDLVVAILSDDVGLLSQIKGIGKKTAERICLELKDKVTPVGFETYISNSGLENSAEIEEAIDALISLGLSKNEATRLAKSGSKNALSAPEIVSNALRLMK